MTLKRLQEAMMDFLEDNDNDYTALQEAVSENSVQRLNVYRNGYRIRQSNLLKQAYPALQRLLGTKLFSGLSCDYLKASPPRESTGLQFIRDLPHYMCDQLGEKEAVVELAEFECEVYRVSLEQSSDTLTRSMWFSLAEKGEENEFIFRLVDSVGLLPLRFNTRDTWCALIGRSEIPEPVHQSGCVLIWRDANDQVVTEPLETRAYLFLESLLSGDPLKEACEKISAYFQTESEVISYLSNHLLTWVDRGLFAA